MAERRNVKSDDSRAADEHERGRDYLGQAQIDLLLAAAKKAQPRRTCIDGGYEEHKENARCSDHSLRVV